MAAAEQPVISSITVTDLEGAFAMLFVLMKTV